MITCYKSGNISLIYRLPHGVQTTVAAMSPPGASEPEEVPVLVVGAGPTGLALACGLRRRDVDCRIIDAGEGPTPPEESRALGIQARTMEVFEALGVADAVRARGLEVRAANAYAGGRRLARFELDLEAETQGFEVSGATGPQLKTDIKQQIARWGRLVNASGFNVEDRGSTR